MNLIPILCFIIVFICLAYIRAQKKESFTSVKKPKCESNYHMSGLAQEDFPSKALDEFYAPIGSIVSTWWSPIGTESKLTLDTQQSYKPSSGKTSYEKIKSIKAKYQQKRQAVGTILCSILPLGEKDQDIFAYNGYLLFPLGDQKPYSFTANQFTQLNSLMTTTNTKIYSMMNKSLFYTTDTSLTGAEKTANTTSITISDDVCGMNHTDDTGGKGTVQIPFSKRSGITVDTRDEGHMVYFYLIIGYV